MDAKPTAARPAARGDGDEGRLEMSGPLGEPSPDLAAEAERVAGLLRGKAVARIWQHRPEALGIEFADGTKLYIEQQSSGLEMNVIGRVG